MSHQVPMYCDDTTSPPTLWGWDWVCDEILCAYAVAPLGVVYANYSYNALCELETTAYEVCKSLAGDYSVTLPDCCTNDCPDCSCNDTGENQFGYQIRYKFSIWRCIETSSSVYEWVEIMIQTDWSDWGYLSELSITGPPARCVWTYDFSSLYSTLNGSNNGLEDFIFDPCGDSISISAQSGYLCDAAGDIVLGTDLGGCGQGVLEGTLDNSDVCSCQSGVTGYHKVIVTFQLRRYTAEA